MPRVEPPIEHRDVTTIMGLIGDIQADVKRIRALLEDEYGEEEEEERESDG
jgi:phage host-nuclease inhibitor protein Gam